jgi:hypothetical protein
MQAKANEKQSAFGSLFSVKLRYYAISTIHRHRKLSNTKIKFGFCLPGMSLCICRSSCPSACLADQRQIQYNFLGALCASAVKNNTKIRDRMYE